MNKVDIMVAGKNQSIIDKVSGFLRSNNNWLIESTVTAEEAIEKFHQRDFDIVVLTSGFTSEEERKLDKVFHIQNPDLILLKNDNDNALDNVISAALNKRFNDRKPQFTFLDDALKNTAMNISIQ